MKKGPETKHTAVKSTATNLYKYNLKITSTKQLSVNTKNDSFSHKSTKSKWHTRQTTSTPDLDLASEATALRRYTNLIIIIIIIITSALPKKLAMLENDTAPNWDRMTLWLLNGQWQVTCSSICIIPQSIFPDWRLYLPASMANLCDDNLNRVAYTRSQSGILSTFSTHIEKIVTLGFIWTYVLNFVQWLLSSSPLARLNTNCILFSKSSRISLNTLCSIHTLWTGWWKEK